MRPRQGRSASRLPVRDLRRHIELLPVLRADDIAGQEHTLSERGSDPVVVRPQGSRPPQRSPTAGDRSRPRMCPSPRRTTAIRTSPRHGPRVTNGKNQSKSSEHNAHPGVGACGSWCMAYRWLHCSGPYPPPAAFTAIPTGVLDPWSPKPLPSAAHSSTSVRHRRPRCAPSLSIMPLYCSLTFAPQVPFGVGRRCALTLRSSTFHRVAACEPPLWRYCPLFPGLTVCGAPKEGPGPQGRHFDAGRSGGHFLALGALLGAEPSKVLAVFRVEGTPTKGRPAPGSDALELAGIMSLLQWGHSLSCWQGRCAGVRSCPRRSSRRGQGARVNAMEDPATPMPMKRRAWLPIAAGIVRGSEAAENQPCRVPICTGRRSTAELFQVTRMEQMVLKSG